MSARLSAESRGCETYRHRVNIASSAFRHFQTFCVIPRVTAIDKFLGYSVRATRAFGRPR
jgi:hypothetical protein